ncbi:cytochrome c4 [Pseudomonas sp. G11-1]|uniref:Cytochrome c4 n=1 Tax=Halopseudomonas bauzanensis TaxID=653930 RepID=A0A031MBT6_9GAMM|nr:MULTISPECIES: c-type cytochrome [Halopseudomonas]MCO5786910.1 cytochrome c4 [Pseudomonas sp. G11-1]MCO5790136.1 cytochrome c4 [Pseudomonas sp. G11-2]EZQ18037.1 cytochrome C [Halopseudomonas bauzanensis]TKA92805.1 cytochrome c4 [Halopseudomonas bauzanensis]WGK61726.1 c-type cytochrome [Halopseudomonas sp. SMJS2]
MNKLLVSLVLSLGVAGSAHALQGDAEAGQGKVAVCAACHGNDGNSIMPNWPNLAGQGERYLLKQLVEIKEGVRVVPEMTAIVANMSDQDLADAAAFYAAQTPARGVADPELAARGEAIYRGGDLATGLPACTGCHSPTGQGNDPAAYPQLAGQHATYTAKQLTDFREGDRVNDGDAMIMQTIASRLSNKDIEAVSNYIQGLR